MATRREFPHVHPKDRAAWRRWLADNHDSSDGVWLIYDKKGARPDRLAYAAAVEEALCYGWIDSVLNAIDESRYKQLYSPRKPTSEWSALNKRRIESTIDAGLMTEHGLAKIAIAKQNGSWTRIDHVENLQMPADLAVALKKNKQAAAGYEKAARFTKKMVLHRVNSAVRPETRAARIVHVVQLLATGMRPGMTTKKPTKKTTKPKTRKR
jgi:uncharacterized protein YdeI (YjbR/CyaY-like superfamily)